MLDVKRKRKLEQRSTRNKWTRPTGTSPHLGTEIKFQMPFLNKGISQLILQEEGIVVRSARHQHVEQQEEQTVSADVSYHEAHLPLLRQAGDERCHLGILRVHASHSVHLLGPRG